MHSRRWAPLLRVKILLLVDTSTQKKFSLQCFFIKCYRCSIYVYKHNHTNSLYILKKEKYEFAKEREILQKEPYKLSERSNSNFLTFPRM